jgi:diguanylate cyclase (GGDEF)-like protein
MNVTRYRCSVLVVDDDPAILSLLQTQLAADFEVLTSASSEHARGILTQRSVDILLTDLALPDESGLGLLDWVRRTSPRTYRVLLTGTARLEDAVDAINHTQIHRIVLKPWRSVDLLQSLRSTSRALLLERSHEQLLDEMRKLNLELEQRVVDRTRELEIALGQLQQKNNLLEKMAMTDSLTGLPNRRSIELIAKKEFARRIRSGGALAIGLIDADHFKDINTQYTLSGGDHVLIWLGRTLNESVRGSDSLGRVGGEEFMVVATSTDAVGAEVLAERLRSNVETGQTTFSGKPIRLTVSVGFAVAETDTLIGFDEVREAAAEALKEAKLIRNRSVVRTVRLTDS